MEIRTIDPELRLVPYYPDYERTFAWYQDPVLCRQVDNIDHPYTMERLQSMYTFLSTHGDCFYIEYRGEPVGDITLRENGEVCIVVAPAYQNRGLGRKSVRELLRLAEEKGIAPVTAEIYTFNTQSRRMFASLGFLQTAREHFTHGITLAEGGISLQPMTRAMNRELFRAWENDETIYADKTLFKPYVYSEESADRLFAKKFEPSRIQLAIMLGGRVIGGLDLKRIDWDNGECTLSIHLQNDSVKGHGYGTLAEKLALRYAFDILQFRAVNADTILKNTRSAHVLEKVGFRPLHADDAFRYYRIERQERPRI